MSYRIPFIQYLRLKGRRQLQFYFLKDEDVFNKAMEVIEKGGRFEAEALTIGNCVSFECVCAIGHRIKPGLWRYV